MATKKKNAPKNAPKVLCARCGKPATHDVVIMAHACAWGGAPAHHYPVNSRATLHLSVAACANCAREAARLALEFLRPKT